MFNWRALVLPSLLCLALSGCANRDGRLPAISAAAQSGYRLGPGDQLRISVSGLDAITNTYLVDDSGAVALPMLSPVVVSGKTLRESEGAIADAIQERQLVLAPRVSVQMLAYRPFYIAGEVQKPGQYPYVPGMSLMTAVAVAGGYTFRADTKKATITRASTKGGATQDTPVLPGDLIVIRERWF
jgi:protein involved in polysaccharide export with SLBB domain